MAYRFPAVMRERRENREHGEDLCWSEAEAAPATVSGERPPPKPLTPRGKRDVGKADGTRQSREPGDLPVHAAHPSCGARGGTDHP